jgi:hypothetical protein
VARALDRGVGDLLLTATAGEFGFRHALTRDAVLEMTLPPRRTALPAAALAMVEAANPARAAPGAIWLAAMAGNREQAGELLAASGCSSLARGALATAADTLLRAAAMPTARDARIGGERHDASSGTATCDTTLTRPSRLKHLQAERKVVQRHRHPAAAPCATVRHRTVPAGGQHRPACAAPRHT